MLISPLSAHLELSDAGIILPHRLTGTHHPLVTSYPWSLALTDVLYVGLSCVSTDWASAVTSHAIVLHESSEVIRHLTRHSMYSSWFTYNIRAPEPPTCWYEVILSSPSYLGSRPLRHPIAPILKSLPAHFNNLTHKYWGEVDTVRWLSGVTFWLQTRARLCSLIHKFIAWATLICVCFKGFLAAGKLAACRCSDRDVSFLGFGPFSKLSEEQ